MPTVGASDDVLRRLREIEKKLGIGSNPPPNGVFFQGTPSDADLLVYNGTTAEGDTLDSWMVRALSGDATIDDLGALTLASTAVTPGSYGDASNYPTFTVDAKGRLTTASTQSVTGAQVATLALFGDGSDGDATISGTTTLAKDTYYDHLTVQNGGILKTGGFRVLCKTSCTVDAGGVISNDGGDASTSTAGGAAPSGSVGGGTAGKNGVTASNGSNGTGASNAIGGSGGAGGGDGIPVFSGGTGGTATPAAASTGGIRDLWFVLGGRYLTSTQANGGCGGSSGGAAASSTSGASGGGGGVVLLLAKSLVLNGTIRAIGGAGGNATGATNAGGGGGGGGGAILVAYNSKTGSGSFSVAGGSPGTGIGSGLPGSSGSSGTLIELPNAA